MSWRRSPVATTEKRLKVNYKGAGWVVTGHWCASSTLSVSKASNLQYGSKVVDWKVNRKLGDGLILRTATMEDLPAIIEHNLIVHDEGVVGLTESIYRRMADFKLEDSFIVVDSNSRKVVSHIMLLPVTWVIDGAEIPAAQMEMVGTRKEYRNRGLIQKLNEAYEERALQRGVLIWVIAGIPYFYKMFGYKYAASLGGGLIVPSELIPKLKDGESEPVSVVRVNKKSLAQFLRFREKHAPKHTFYRKLRSIEYNYLDYADVSLTCYAYNFFTVREAGAIVGSFSLRCDEGVLNLAELCLENPQHTASVLRHVEAMATKLGGVCIRVVPPGQEAVREIVIAIARNHFPRAYAWYVKIPSVASFLETIGSVLTMRLKGTEYDNFTGNLIISSYRELYTLQFENGAFQKVTQGKDAGTAHYDAAFSPDALTRLIMGYETLDELQLHEPDVSCRASMKPIVRLLFPRVTANIEPEY